MKNLIQFRPPGVPASGDANRPLVLKQTRASNDQELVASWLANLPSAHSRRNFAATAGRLLEELQRRGLTLQTAVEIETVREVLAAMTDRCAYSTSRQYMLRVKSLFGYSHRLGYTLTNPAAGTRLPREQRALAKRILAPLAVRDMIRHSRRVRDRVLQTLIYGGGLRVSEATGLNVGDVIRRDDQRIQLHIVGKGAKERETLVPGSLTADVLELCGDRPAEAALFVTRSGRRLGPRGVNHLIKGVAKRARLTSKVSPHWLRHAHASHALSRGASVAVVAKTLGHENVATTSIYLHAMPGEASGDSLDPDVWAAEELTNG